MDRSKEVTIYDIAETLNISAATVSRGLKDHPAISKETKRKILDAAQRMGYQQNIFASNLRKQRTNTIGVVVPRLNSYFMSTVIAGIEKAASQAGFNLIISQSLESVRKEITNVKTLFNSRVDGMLVSLACDTVDTEHFQFLFRKRIPLIFFDRVLENDHATCIIIDNTRAAYDVCSHLLAQGCRKIVHIGGDLRSRVYAGRLQGYQQALAEYGIPFDPELLFINDLSENAATEAAMRILQMRPLPDAIFAANDTSAVACIGTLLQAGVSVPEDVAVAGFNDDPLSRVVRPQLTTIHYPGQTMGELAASTLIEGINQTASSRQGTLLLKHQLIIRPSTLKQNH